MTHLNQIPPSHPGRVLKKEIESRKLTQKEFSLLVGLPPSHISEIVNEKRKLTPEIAVTLSEIWDTNPNSWVRMQADYDLFIAQQKREEERKETFSEKEYAKKYLSLDYLQKVGVIKRKSENYPNQIRKYFGWKTLMDVEPEFNSFTSSPAFYRKADHYQQDIVQRFTWESIVRTRAKKEEIDQFFPWSLEHLTEELQEHFWNHYAKPSFSLIPRVKNSLNRHGIIFLIQPKPQKGPFDGYAFLSEGRPGIAMTLRYKRLDNFAFTLMHEVAHVYKHFQDLNQLKHFDSVDDKKEIASVLRKIEEEADEFAQRSLIPDESWREFTEYVKKTDEGILFFAEHKKIHPGILRGRLCREFPSYYKRRTEINALNKLSHI